METPKPDTYSILPCPNGWSASAFMPENLNPTRAVSYTHLDVYKRQVLPATLAARTFVIAAVNVVLPWSTCPMVPMLQCGFVLSNLAFAILNVLLE